jgi:hypothetical protein
MGRFKTHTFRKYMQLPIAGFFLSKRTEVEAAQLVS